MRVMTCVEDHSAFLIKQTVIIIVRDKDLSELVFATRMLVAVAELPPGIAIQFERPGKSRMFCSL